MMTSRFKPAQAGGHQIANYDDATRYIEKRTDPQNRTYYRQGTDLVTLSPFEKK
jgi:hypothetical protein